MSLALLSLLWTTWEHWVSQNRPNNHEWRQLPVTSAPFISPPRKAPDSPWEGDKGLESLSQERGTFSKQVTMNTWNPMEKSLFFVFSYSLFPPSFLFCLSFIPLPFLELPNSFFIFFGDRGRHVKENIFSSFQCLLKAHLWWTVSFLREWDSGHDSFESWTGGSIQWTHLL
jgi:hypothetical protein